MSQIVKEVNVHVTKAEIASPMDIVMKVNIHVEEETEPVVTYNITWPKNDSDPEIFE